MVSLLRGKMRRRARSATGSLGNGNFCASLSGGLVGLGP